MVSIRGGFLALTLCFAMSTTVTSDDWLRFRGNNGSGVNKDGPTPATWSDEENLKWKAELPGAGASSPIVVGDRIFVTSYYGYGVDGDMGDIEELGRALVCIDRETGDVIWQKQRSAEGPEDPYRGMGIPAHGYASNTPVSDGEFVYVFYGKTGVIAYDLDGNEQWQTSVGTSSGSQRWGSGASPIICGDHLIVNASDEDTALYGINKSTGDIVWRQQVDGIANTWGTPVVAEIDGRTQVLILVPYEVWSINPENGKLIWYAEGTNDGQINSSLVPADDVFIAMGERGGQTVAIRPEGKSDISESSLVWRNDYRGRIATPIAYNGYLFWVSNGIVNCVEIESGEVMFQERLESGGNEGGRGGRFGRGSGGGGDYASPVAADGKIYATTGSGAIHVFAAEPEFELIATNQIESDRSGFNGTPAISNGEIFIRSNTHLYCIAE